MEEMDELDKLIDEQINNELSKLIVNDIGPFTCQFLKRGAHDEMKAFASGVLAQLGESYYIFTASHVIEDWSNANPLFLEIQGAYVSVVGYASGTEIDKGAKIDVAYIRLKPAFVPVVKQWYRFLPMERFTQHQKLLDTADYCVYGFPVSIQKKQNGILKPFGAAYFLAPHRDKVYEYYGLDPLAHYVLEFIGKATNIQSGQYEKIKAEHYGLSGCGLWYTTVKLKRNKIISEAHLIGIMTEFRKGKFDCLIGNRIEVLLASLHKHEGLVFKKS